MESPTRGPTKAAIPAAFAGSDDGSFLIVAAATPITASFSSRPVVQPYAAIASNITMTKNPGKAAVTSIPIDGAESAWIPNEEWASVKGAEAAAAR
jgi:hypothetical protein